MPRVRVHVQRVSLGKLDISSSTSIYEIYGNRAEQGDEQAI